MKSFTAKRLDAIHEYYFSKKLREIDDMNKQSEVKVINLGIGSPDQPPHPDVIKALHEAALRPDTHAYQSYKGAPALRQAFADWYQKSFGVILDSDREILPLIGSKEGIMHISMTFLNDGDEVLVPNPGYPTYRSATMLAGGVCIDYDLKAKNNWLPDLPTLAKKDLSRVKLMWVNYPQMPTGANADEAFFTELVAFAQKHHILICHDNPYSFILPGEKNMDAEGKYHPLSLLKIAGAKEVALELNSLSKSHNMAGWRIGAVAAKEDVIQEVLRFKSNMDSGMFLPLQLAAAKALQLDEQWYHDLNKVYLKRRNKVYEMMDMLDCHYEKGQSGMFVWAKVPANYKDGYDLSDEVLYKCSVFLTPGGIFGSNGDNYVRVSLCRSEEILEEAIKRIKKVIRHRPQVIGSL
ncbi:MAG: aminotransferase class I/II-fold pyridoxal phosphate-dependent enzyme [Chitinophagaceae bacterium]|nr:MAG: aminotransferase class I/II-fold pyridoxal phosphate-dependent enzyme [Chitinophagaceae bacterium]